MSNHEFIETEILNKPSGSVFVASDFVDSASYDNIRQIFSRLENEGKIRRILPGIYDRPEYSNVIQEYSAPDPNRVAHAIARKNNWQITPSGNAALNLLGLSTQVPARWEYISSGPSNEYQIDNTTLSLIHRADKELTGMSPKTALIIQAIKAIGKDYVSDAVVNKISEQLESQERITLLTEAKPTIAWIYEVIKRVCAANNDNI